MTEQPDLLLDDFQVARILSIEPDTLRAWRRHGRGPAFIEMGPKTFRYQIQDVRDWIQKQRREDGAL